MAGLLDKFMRGQATASPFRLPPILGGFVTDADEAAREDQPMPERMAEARGDLAGGLKDYYAFAGRGGVDPQPPQPTHVPTYAESEIEPRDGFGLRFNNAIDAQALAERMTEDQRRLADPAGNYDGRPFADRLEDGTYLRNRQQVDAPGQGPSYRPSLPWEYQPESADIEAILRMMAKP